MKQSTRYSYMQMFLKNFVKDLVYRSHTNNLDLHPVLRLQLFVLKEFASILNTEKN
jgi:hypothetical protein